MVQSSRPAFCNPKRPRRASRKPPKGPVDGFFGGPRGTAGALRGRATLCYGRGRIGGAADLPLLALRIFVVLLALALMGAACAEVGAPQEADATGCPEGSAAGTDGTCQCLPGVPVCGGLCRPDLAPLDLDYLADADACATYECGATYPAACLTLPVWQLFVEDSNLALLYANRDADLEVPARLLVDDLCRPARLELHGGLARTFDKKSFQVTLQGGGLPFDPFGDALDAAGLPVEDLILKAQWVDPSFVRDALAHELVRAAGGLAPRVRFVHLVLARHYHGLYALTEAVDGRFLQGAGLPPRGDLYKAVNHNANFQKKDNFLAGYEKKQGSEDSDAALGALLAALWACPSGDQACFDADVLPHLDLDSYFAYLAANALADNRDAFTKNYYLFSSSGGTPGPFFTVNWDADATFGLNWDGNVAQPPVLGPWGRPTGLSNRLAALPNYRALYLEMLAALSDAALEGGLLEARLTELEAALAPDLRFEECRWNRPGAFAQSIALIRDFLANRPGSL